MNLTAGIPEEVMQNLTRNFWPMRLHPNVEIDTPGQKLAAQLLQAVVQGGLAFSAISDGQAQATLQLATPGVRSLRRVNLAEARDGVLKRIGSHAYVSLREEPPEEKESLERELLKTPVVLQQSRRKPQKVKAAQKKVEGGLRLLTISEEDFPASAPEAYLEREQRRFFRLGGGALGDERTPVCAKNGEVVALVYLGNKLTSRIDLSALPKPQKKLIMHKSFFRGVQGARASIKKSTAKPTTTGTLRRSNQVESLNQIVESLHLRIRDVMAVELGRDVALEFCSASRFSIFVQSIARLAMHHRSVQNHRGTMHESVRNRLKSLEKFLLDLDTKLRSMHVSLRLLAEESRRLLSRSAREHELQTQAKHSLAKVRERKHVVQSHIAAVDARHGNDLEKALGRANSSLRQLKQLERQGTRGTPRDMKARETEELNVPIFRRMAIPSHAQMAAVAAAGGAVGTPKVSKPPTRSETLDEDIRWCHSSNLWSMSPAASRLSQWLHARLECHRVLMRMEDDRQSMGDLSTQLQEVTVAVATAEAELQRAAKTLERLEATVNWGAFIGPGLEIAAPRRRECEVVVPLLREAEESPEQWGAILTIGVLSCYGASFSHHLRQAIMKELHQVLQEGGVPTPSNLFTSAELGNFFPQSFVRKAVQAWPSSQQLQGAVAMEASGSLCTLMLDPFGSALEWLKELHTQRNPVASGGGDRTEFDKHLQRQPEEAALPMVHYRFHLYVMAPRCPWSRSLWGPAKIKQAEQLMREAPNAARKRQDQQLVLMAQETRLLVSEELILHLLGKMENSDMQSDKVVRPLQKFHACASRLARSVSMGLQERQQRRKAEKSLGMTYFRIETEGVHGSRSLAFASTPGTSPSAR
eukprot:g26169.t1